MLSLLLVSQSKSFYLFFFFNDASTTVIYTLSLHDALPISRRLPVTVPLHPEIAFGTLRRILREGCRKQFRSEEHTSELQSRQYLVCRLLLEKKKEPLAYSSN